MAGALLLVGAVCLGLSACGSSSSSGQANSLLKQTFSGNHPVNSGDLSFNLTLTPAGSTTLKTPIRLSFGGPFQSLGKGRLPKSNFNVGLSASGTGGSIGILSTGTAGYVTLQGVSYQLPAATFKRLESSFQGLASSPSGGGSGTLSRLGIHPLNWVNSPSVIGQENVGGTSTTHIRATIDIASLLTDLNTFLHKASSVGVSGAGSVSSLSTATRSQIASAVRNPTFDVWTGNSDKTVRKLVLEATIPVSGQVSTMLGGLRSAGIALTMRYANLNQPQTITAPTNTRPYTQFAAKLRTFLTAAEGSLNGASAGLGSAGLGSATAPSGTSTAPGSSGSSAGSAGGTSSTSTNVQRYSQCIVSAHNNVAKMQKCAALINGQ